MSERLTKSFTRNQWLGLRSSLKDKALLTAEWRQAIKLLKERIFERYFDPLDILITNSTDRGEGFTIATIECALIEFLSTLEAGRVYKRDKESTDPQYYYKRSADMYQHFLRNASIFDTIFFSANSGPHLFTANDFYKNVRCALLHEAQTRNNWEIRIYKDSTSDKTNRISFEVDSIGKKVIYRTAFCTMLKEYFSDFIKNKVSAENNRGRTHRKNLARKIDHIAEVQPDSKYWW